MRHSKCEAGKGGLSVRVDRDNIEKALRIFKKKVMNDGILKDLKKSQFYEKPSEKKRREKAEARRHHLKAEALKRKFAE